MFSRFDHIMIAADGLDPTRRQFAELGLTVVQRVDEGAPPAVEQALVCFADDSYLEIVFLGRADGPALAHRYWGRQRHGMALSDYSLATDDIEHDIRLASQRGLPTEAPKYLRRRRSDGLEWEIGFSTLGISVGAHTLPFLVENRTDPSVRAPGGPARVHPNGATGVHGVTLASEDPAATVAALGKALDVVLSPASCDAYGDFFCGPVGLQDRWVAVLGPDSADRGVEAHLTEFGEGIYEISLSRAGVCPEPGSGRQLAPGSSLRIRMG